MITLYQIGTAGYWTGQTQIVTDDANIPSGWTARALPEPIPNGQYAIMTLTGWKLSKTPAPVAAAEQQVLEVRPDLLITSITTDTEHAAQSMINGVTDVTCTVGSILTFNAELRDQTGNLIPMSDSFRMPLRSRDGREKVLLAVMDQGLVKINAPMRASGVWYVTEETVNESLPYDHKMSFAGIQVYVVEA